jgi:hypothetical protein
MSHAHDRRKTSDRHARPKLEALEDRLLLYSTTGDLWSHPARITFSFVPDGTSIGGPQSNLFAKFNSVAPTQTWETLFLKAAAVWEQVANINLVQVSDSGAAIGASYYQQGDPSNGDIRIGGFAQDMGTLAFTILPPPANGGSAAGDMFFNTSQSWQINNNYDILTVAIHEFGHALGMSHSATTTADMYAYYYSLKQYLTSDDVAGIQAIYGARQPDSFAGPNGNATSATATDVAPWINTTTSQIALYYLDIMASSTSEWFKVAVPSTTTGSMLVTIQSTGLSELSPYVQVYNSSFITVGSASAPNTYGSLVSVTIPSVSAGQVYYFRASGANAGPTSTGNYALFMNFGSVFQYPVGPPNTYVGYTADQGGGGAAEGTGNGKGDQRGWHSWGNGDGEGNHGWGHSKATSDGAGDQGNIMVIGGMEVMADALTIVPVGGNANAGVTVSDVGLLIAPSTQAHDAALDNLAVDLNPTQARGRGGMKAAWLPRTLSLV